MPHEDDKPTHSHDDHEADDAPVNSSASASDEQAEAPPDKGDAKPIELEPADEPEAEPVATVPVEDVEHCPSCGAPMPESDAIVCLRCGYDLKRLEVTRIAVGQTEVDDDENDEQSDKPVSRPGRGDHWLPLAMALISGGLLLVGYLSGTLGLFPAVAATGTEEAPAVVPMFERFIGVLRFVVLMALWSMCGLAGLFLLAQTLSRPMGDLMLASVRVLGIVVTIRLVSFLNVPGPRWVEWLSEAVLQAGAFIALSILLFALKPRDGAVMGGFALFAFVALWLFGRVMIWTIEGA